MTRHVDMDLQNTLLVKRVKPFYFGEIRSNQGMLVCHRRNRLQLAVIRKAFSPTPLQMFELLSHVQHPNVADILSVYFHYNKLYIVSKHLDVSMLGLEFKRLAPEEWEIATIIAEVSLL
jgi:hypothetical protein